MFAIAAIIVLCNARRLGTTLWIPKDLGSNTKCRWGAQFNLIWKKILIEDTKKPFTTVYTVLTCCLFIEGHTYYIERNDERFRLFHLTGPTVADCCQEIKHYLCQIWSKSMSRNDVTRPTCIIRVHAQARTVCICAVLYAYHSSASHTGLFQLQCYVLRGGTYVGLDLMKLFFNVPYINVLLKAYHHTSMK